MRALALLYVLMVSLCIPGTARADEERRIALVIGNAAYQNAPDLTTPLADARALADALEGLGFATDLRLDLDQRGLQEALRAFGYGAQSAEVALFFYSGHGLQAAGENYLLPIDAELRRERDLIYESMPLTVVMGEVSLARRLGIVILDAARDNPLAESLRRALGPVRARIVGRGLAPMTALPADTLVALSTAPGEVMPESEGGRGFYVPALLEVIDEPGVVLEQVFARTDELVQERSGGLQSPATYDQLGIEPFYFVPPRPNRDPVVGLVTPVLVADDAGAVRLPLPDIRDPDEDPLQAEVTDVPAHGRILAAGRPVEVGDVLSFADLEEVAYRPAAGFAGEAGFFEFMVLDDQGGQAGVRLPITIERSNRPPQVVPPRLFQLPPLALGLKPPVDPDGGRLTIRVDQVPEIGTIRDGGRIVVVGDELSPSAFQALTVVPRGNRVVGTFAYAAVDAGGASASSSITFDLGPATRQLASGGSTPSTGTLNGGPAARPAFEPFRVIRTANVRSGPSSGTGRITTLRAGTVLKVLDQRADSDWYEIETLEGDRGYIYGELLEPVPESELDKLDPRLRPGVRKAAAIHHTLSGEVRDCENCPVLVPVPGSTFLMGANDGHPSERPARSVTIEPFAIGKYEVTVGQWRACVAAGACATSPRLKGLEPDLPAHDLSWQDARDYVRWLAQRTGKPYRLPSEAEWEYAARAGTTSRFWWGEQVGEEAAECSSCGGVWDPERPLPVGTKLANPFGLYGTSGGVMEWVQDCWSPSHADAPVDGSARQQEGCERRVLRGGSWQNDDTYATSASRLGYGANIRYVTNGFRVARNLD